jgi:hypothetical protein
MGFFSKIGKGISKAFKKIGKGIKSAFKSFGKFMNKFGVLGQIGMFFIMPHIAGALMKGMGAVWSGIAGQTAAQGAAAAATAGTNAAAAAAAGGASAAGQAAASLTASTAVNTAASGLAGATGSGALSVASRAVGSLMRGAGNFVSKGINVFRNVTEGATNFIKEFSQTAANKLSSTMGFENLPFENAAENFFGAGDSAWKATTDEAGFRMKNLLADKSTTSAFDAAARESRIAISTPTAAITPTKIKGTQVETVKTEVDPNAAIAETETIDLTSNTGGEIDRAGEVQGDVNASFKPTTDSRSVVDKTRDYLQDSLLSAREKVSSEFTNLVPNTIERTAEGITGIPNQLVNTKIQNLMAPDAPQQFVAMGPAQYMAPEIGGGQDVTGMMPLADYGVRMGTMPYGNNAVIAAHQRFMQSSIG